MYYYIRHTKMNNKRDVIVYSEDIKFFDKNIHVSHHKKELKTLCGKEFDYGEIEIVGYIIDNNVNDKVCSRCFLEFAPDYYCLKD